MEFQLTILNLLFSAITASCAIYLSFMALRHTAKPKIDARMATSPELKCSETTTIRFELLNTGHWYAQPAAISVRVFINFDPNFELSKITSGTYEQWSNEFVGIGNAGMKFVRMKDIYLTYGEEPVPFTVHVLTPEKSGKYPITIAALSDNGASLFRKFSVECT